uniref:Uncharacterized protein n=1 Tax=Coccidioides posadasii RMSCC 3488 TaxID=454284 RepID=A0A0J6FCV7_COCPO|nr:hypothetical protein CPAG_07220 [Coccidioides posadasii RMSCC 3488]
MFLVAIALWIFLCWQEGKQQNCSPRRKSHDQRQSRRGHRNSKSNNESKSKSYLGWSKAGITSAPRDNGTRGRECKSKRRHRRHGIEKKREPRKKGATQSSTRRSISRSQNVSTSKSIQSERKLRKNNPTPQDVGKRPPTKPLNENTAASVGSDQGQANHAKLSGNTAPKYGRAPDETLDNDMCSDNDSDIILLRGECNGKSTSTHPEGFTVQDTERSRKPGGPAIEMASKPENT